MEKYLEKFLKNQLVSGSLVLFIGGTVANFGNYLFHLLMGRFLGPAGYAVLASLTSILYLGGVPSSSLSLTSAKLAASSKAKNNLDEVKFFLLRASQVFYLIGLGVFSLFWIGQDRLAQFLKIEDPSLFVFVGGIFFFIFLMAVNNGLLQGFKKFSFLAGNSVLGVVVKLGLGAVLVWQGFGVGGALVAFLVSSLVPYAVSFYPLRFLLTTRTGKTDGRAFLKKTFSFTGPAFFALLGLIFLYTMDVVLVKHFFSEVEAGLYSAVSLAGKVIVFVSSPIIAVMFPLIAESYVKKRDFKRILASALVLILGISLLILLVYLCFPGLVVWFFFGKKFLEASHLLGRFAFFIFFYTFCQVMVSFFLSIQKTGVAFLPLAASLIQIVLIWFFHDSLTTVISISTLVSFLLLSSLGVFYFKVVK